MFSRVVHVFTVLLRSFSAVVRACVGPWSGHPGGMVATGTPFVPGASGVSQGYTRRQHGRNTDAARWQTEPVHRLSRSCSEAAPKLLRSCSEAVPKLLRSCSDPARALTGSRCGGFRRLFPAAGF